MAMESVVSEKPAISLVIPVYNEAPNLLPLYQRIRSACEPLGQPYEIVFVDDGSQDDTFATLAELHRQDARVHVVRFRKNYGQTAAMAAGFQYAKGAIILSMDGDLQNDPADIPRLLAKLAEGYDVVCGWRKDRQDKLLSRRVPSVIANFLIGKITGVPIHDNGCSLKAYRAKVIKRVPLYAELHRFIPAMSTLAGARIAEIVVQHHARQFGRSKYGLSRIWRVFLDLFLIKMLLGFATRPLCWFGMLSLPSLVIGCASLLASFEALPTGSISIIAPSMTFLMFFLSFHLITLGTLSELIQRVSSFNCKNILTEVETESY
jgi:glycosyltransferase involved in cell wall biosynthesis